MKVPQSTIYTKSAGVEIGPYEKRQEGKPHEGRISLRFFKMEGGTQMLRFVVEPWEGLELSRIISNVYREGGKQTLTHKFKCSSGEIVTRLSIEKFERNGKPGYALTIQRDSDSINVSIPAGQFLYAAEFLGHLSLTEAWVEELGHGTGEKPSS